MNNSKKGKMPVQGAPVLRGGNQGAFSNGVEAQGWFDIAKSIGKAALPVVTSLVGQYLND